jgi:hypothetical protein
MWGRCHHGRGVLAGAVPDMVQATSLELLDGQAGREPFSAGQFEVKTLFLLVSQFTVGGA